MATLKLLIVDDDAVDRRAVRRALKEARVEAEVVECATAGCPAIGGSFSSI